jgi:23S rRNA G2069 N7-methylase RlmK/C1962 C5-methylase RlmI
MLPPVAITASMLANRLRNRMRHLAKWARRNGVTCFRVYERDIPDFPIVIDWYDGDAVAWFHHRTKDDSLDREIAYRKHAEQEILDALGIARNRLHLKYRGRQRDGEGGRDQYERLDTRGVLRTVEEDGLLIEVNLSDYLDTGLFLDHRATRGLVGSMAAGKRFLNLFCYTAVFTLHARKGGAAATTSVDLSKTYLAWAERNHQMNGFALGGPHGLVHADCLQWLEREPEAGEAYDLIVCDPPTFSNSKRMRADSFAIDRDWTWLLGRLRGLLAPGGTAFFSTNSRRFPFEPAAVPEGLHVREITRQTLPEDFKETRIHRCFRLEHKRAGAAGEPGVSMSGP